MATYQEEVEKLNQALRDFIMICAEELGLIKLMDIMERNLEQFKESVLSHRIPKLRRIQVECSECGEVMFEINTEDITGPVGTVCDKCMKKKLKHKQDTGP